jgi:DNA mismatch endonuclease (patch repair protein)
VFIDGCFWHRCPEHYQRPKANREFWDAKIGGSVERDQCVDAALMGAGWTVLRFWEHTPSDEIAGRVAEVVRLKSCPRPRRAR